MHKARTIQTHFDNITPIDVNNILKKNIVKFASTGTGFKIEPGSELEEKIKKAIKEHPNALFIRAKAIKADEANSNGDFFTKDELRKSYKTFEGVPFFTNHENDKIENAKGKIIYAEIVETEDEMSIYTIGYIDREAYPNICRGIEEGYISGVSMGSISGDSLITMADLSEKKISEIKVGEEVFTPYGNIKKVLKTYSGIVDSDIYHFGLGSYHKSPKFSQEHPIMILDGNEIKASMKEAISLKAKSAHNKKIGKSSETLSQSAWRFKDYEPEFRESKDIKKGDYFLIPSKYEINKESVKEEDSYYYLMGAYVGGGYLHKNKYGEIHGVCYSLGLHEKQDLVKKLEAVYKNFTDVNFNVEEYPERGGMRVALYDHGIAEDFSKTVGTGAHDKRISKKSFSKSEVCQLIAGYIDTDGSIVKTYNKTNSGEIRGNGIRGVNLYSCNKGLLEDIQNLLIGIGVKTSLSWNYRTPNKNSVVKIPTLDYILLLPYGTLGLFSPYSIKLSSLENDFATQIEGGKTFIFEKNEIKYLAAPVEKITVENDYLEPTYDISVEGDECYIADGLAIHNCSIEYSECSVCNNRAYTTEDFCNHVEHYKGRRFTGKVTDKKSGETRYAENEKVYERNYGLKFIELSAVVDPACSSCHIDTIIDNKQYLEKVASIKNKFIQFRTAMKREASQKEIDDLNNCLKTLEEISVNLIQNRQNVEMDFASDLVAILAELQDFASELTEAGYGSVNNEQGAPADGSQPAMPPPADPNQMPPPPAGAPAPAPAQPQAQNVSATDVGTVSGDPMKSHVQAPQIPIIKPSLRSSTEDRMVILSEKIKNLSDKFIKNKDLSKIMKENNKDLQYMNNIPYIPFVKSGNITATINKNSKGLFIVAKNSDTDEEYHWNEEDLSKEQKELLLTKPEIVAESLINFVTGEAMSEKTKVVAKNLVNHNPDQLQEKQLENQSLLHKRQGWEIDSTIEKQLEGKEQPTTLGRKGDHNYITEKQLEKEKGYAMPRTGAETDEVTEGTLDADSASPRKGVDTDITINKQLQNEGFHTGVEEKVIEKLLDNTPAPWARAANRNPALFKSAKEHLDLVAEAFAQTVVDAGCTPSEVQAVASEAVSGTVKRYEFGKEILAKKETSISKFSSARLGYWASKGIKVSSAEAADIENVLKSHLYVVASNEAINPEVLLDAVEVLSEGSMGMEKIDKIVTAKMKEKTLKVRTSSAKDDLRKALIAEKKMDSVEPSLSKEEIKSLVAVASKNGKKADVVIETNFSEMSDALKAKVDKKHIVTASGKKDLIRFTKQALATENLKIASIVNVTINGETVQIAVQTDEGSQSVEIPVDENPMPDMGSEIPEGDLSGEGLGGAVPSGDMPAQDANMAFSSNKKKQVLAQAPMGGGTADFPNSGMPPPAGVPGTDPANPDEGVQNLTGDEPMEGAEGEEVANEFGDDVIPTAGDEANPPFATCIYCGSTNVDIESAEGKHICSCQDCKGKYEAVITRSINFKELVQPQDGEEDINIDEAAAPAMPEVPVAAQTRLDDVKIKRIASAQKKHGHVCPSCGFNHCKVTSSEEGATSYSCPACGTDVKKEIMVNSSDNSSILRVSWNHKLPVEKCEDCEAEAKRFASSVKIRKMMREAKGKDFPTADCLKVIALKYGGNTTALTGPCKGKPLANCVCGQLKDLGLTKGRYLDRIASASMQDDPIETCIKDHEDEGFSRAEASNVCKCIKAKVAKGGFFTEALSDGKEKIFAQEDLEVLDEKFDDSEIEPVAADIEPIDSDDMEISDLAKADAGLNEVSDEEVSELDEETVTVTLPKEVALDIANQVDDSLVDEVNEVSEEVEVDLGEPTEEPTDSFETDAVSVEEFSDESEEDLNESEIGEIVAMDSRRINRMSAKLNKVKDIESVLDNVPRAPNGGKLGKEGPDNIDVPLKEVKVPRGKSEMGFEETLTLDLPEVASGDAYMNREKEVQKGMPQNTTDIKGTVLAESKGSLAPKKLKQVDTIQDLVGLKKAPNGGKMGNEEPAATKGPKIPSNNSTSLMGNEENIEASEVEVPYGDAYQGGEKETVGTPENDHSYLTRALANMEREKQIERIANARKLKATQVAGKLLASRRIDENSYETVIEALSSFSIDKIPEVASKLYPSKVSASSSERVVEAGNTIPAIVLESKGFEQTDWVQELSSEFSLGIGLPSQEK